jgi:hypothetical protein
MLRAAVSSSLPSPARALAALLADDASGDKPPTHLTFLLNFFDELRRAARRANNASR